MRHVFCGFSLFLAILSVSHFRLSLLARVPAERFAHQLRLERLRPALTETIRLEADGDLASAIVVDAFLQQRSVKPRDGDWRAARDLMLDAVERRPGWSYHLFLLGKLSYAAGRQPGAKWPGGTESSFAPLHRAAAGAPAVDSIWNFLSEAYLESWARIGPAERGKALPVLHRAFLDPDFVAHALTRTVAALGQEEAFRLLPDRAGPLRAAFEALSRGGYAPGAFLLWERMSRAEMGERLSDLRKVEELHRSRDTDGLRAACRAWVSAHGVGDFDGPRGRSQVARLLELWPREAGRWLGDPRGEILRFFLAGRQREVKGEVLSRVAEALSGTPDSVLARTRLLSGNLEGALSLAREAGSSVSLEWTPFFVELARHYLGQMRPREAQGALARLSLAARDECGVLLARRAAARALGEESELQEVRDRLQWLQRDSYPRDAWTPSGSLSLCLDPEWASHRLEVELEAASPSLLSYGWDGGRLGSLLLPGGIGKLSVPLAGLSGYHSFSVVSVAGGSFQVSRTILNPGTPSLPF